MGNLVEILESEVLSGLFVVLYLGFESFHVVGDGSELVEALVNLFMVLLEQERDAMESSMSP